jgi:hypothetical protein
VLRAELLGLGLVDVLHEHALVLERVTLGLEVEGVVTGVSCLLRGSARNDGRRGGRGRGE